MASNTFAKVVTDCDLLKASIEPLLTEMPHLTPEHTELVSFLADLRSLNTRQKELTGQLRRTIRLRQEAEVRGQDLRSRVAAQLRGKLGFKNEQLLKFGVPPRRQRVRRSSEETPPPAPTSTTKTP